MAIRILAAFENDVMLVGVQTIIGQNKDFEAISALNLETAVEAAQHLQPEIILLSDRLNPEQDVLSLVEILLCAAPQSHLVVVGRSQNGATIVELLQGGIGGYLYWYDSLETCLLRALESVLRGRPYLSQTAQSEYLIASQQPTISWRLNRQARSVLQQLSEGCHVKEIAWREGITVRQVYGIQRKLRSRFGAMTNEQLLIRAAEEGFVRLIS